MAITFDSYYALTEYCDAESDKRINDATRALNEENSRQSNRIYELQDQITRLEGELFKLRNPLYLEPDERTLFDKLTAAHPKVNPVGITYRDKLLYLVHFSPDTTRCALVEMYPENRIMRIKLIRTLLSIGLKEAKEFVEGAPLPNC